MVAGMRGVLSLLIVAALGACHYDALDLTGHACPCLAGYQCDPATMTCVAGVAVDAGTDDASVDDAAIDDLAGVDLACTAASCTSTVHGTPMCTSMGCKWTCDPGFAHCTFGDTGCDTDTTSNIKHCGSCDGDCTDSVNHATGVACVSSSCTYAACSSGYTDCDGDKRNGCEANLQTDTRHCGMCTTSCLASVKNVVTITCATGGCNYDVCKPFFYDANANRADGCEAACGGNTQPCCPSGSQCQTSLTCNSGTCG